MRNHLIKKKHQTHNGNKDCRIQIDSSKHLVQKPFINNFQNTYKSVNQTKKLLSFLLPLKNKTAHGRTQCKSHKTRKENCHGNQNGKFNKHLSGNTSDKHKRQKYDYENNGSGHYGKSHFLRPSPAGGKNSFSTIYVKGYIFNHDNRIIDNQTYCKYKTEQCDDIY